MRKQILGINDQTVVWYLIGFICIAEFFLFKSYVLRNITHFYPVGFDQINYLLLSYRIHELLEQQGILSGLLHAETFSNGILFPIQAALFHWVLGPSRLSALLPNILYFIALQLFSLLALRSLSKKNHFSFILLGLIFSIHTPFTDTGNLVDFRMDFIAFCLYGIFVSAAIKSQIFFSRPWSMVTGLVASFCVLFRCITALYLAPVLALMLVYLFYGFKKAANGSLERREAGVRLGNLCVANGVIGLLVLPYVWLNRVPIYSYYVGNHVMSIEKYIRAAEVGATNTLSKLLYYPASLLIVNVGIYGLILGALVLLVYLAIQGFAEKRDAQLPGQYWAQGFVFISLSLAVPLFVLSMDTIKSSVVGSIMVMPLLWLLLWYCLYVDSRRVLNKNWNVLLKWLAMLVFTAGLYQLVHQLNHYPSKTKLRNVSAIAQMYQDIGNYALTKQWTRVDLSVDQIRDYLTGYGITLLFYEEHGKYIPIDTDKLGGTIFAIDKEGVLASLRRSQVVILNLNSYPSGSPYPFDQTVAAFKPLIYKQVEKQFARLGDYTFMGTTYRVYVRP